jgi:creatinine amidohydrolase
MRNHRVRSLYNGPESAIKTKLNTTKMKTLFSSLVLLVVVSCQSHEKVLYEELTPAEFSARLEKCPVAYLPLGTLEWHSDHLPLGSDGLQSQEFFKRLATEAGGIVLPMLFIGPDGHDTIIDGHEYYGMDCGKVFSKQCKYEIQQLTGSAYRVPDSTFRLVLNDIMKQLSRAGFKIVVAHGHGPSTTCIACHAKEYKDKYNLTVMNCWGNDTADLCLQCDHAGANETSIMMYVRPDLVQMQNLPTDTAKWPKGMLGKDPRIYASRKYGKSIVDFEVNKMAAVIREELKKQLP